MKKLSNLRKLLFLLLIVQSIGLKFYAQKNSQISTRAKNVPFTQRLVNGGVNLKGDISFIANNIVSKDQDGTVPNDDYNGTSEGNNRLNLNYIDIDGDATTFSSSKAQLNLPSCSKVIYAGLYWAAVYPYKYWDTKEARSDDFNEIKFKLPGGNYQNIVGDIIFDGQTSNEAEKVVYTCYKDITSIVSNLGDANGDYYAANIKATVRGTSNTGSSGGWIMVVVYENQTEPSRRVSIFDGFASIQGGGNPKSAEISYEGFNTIPVGPVKARMLVAALEGDFNLKGDQFKMEDVTGTYQPLSTPNLNSATNFFNGSITVNDTFQTGRQPQSQNTLGFDADLFNVNNVNNKLIANNQTSAKVSMTSQGDGYWVFLNAMSIDIIEPDIELIKTIEDDEGNDIAGDEVDLGDLIWYNVSFRNKGNDDALNTVLIDRLPKNVDLLEAELSLPPGITYTYEPPVLSNEFRGVLRFNIPDNLVEKGDPKYNIRIKVKVVENCNELRDVCSNRIENQVIASYVGKTSGISINEDPSFYGVDACNIGLQGPSNFLVDVSGCKFERDEILCAENVTLTAGSGFISYEWKNDKGEVIGNSQSITVSETGTYTVSKLAPVGCISSSEIINVVSFYTQDNPLLAYADEVKTCPNDGSQLAEIYLCGDESIKQIETNIDNSDTIIWQKLDETSCAAVTDQDCANVNNTCVWNTVKNGNDFTANSPGQYRLEIRSQGGCFKRFYFNVFKATLNPQIVTEDIICGNSGSIVINNIPNDYEFSLTNNPGSFQDSNTFNISSSGSYSIFIRKKGSAATSCIYTVNNIDVLEKNIDVKLITNSISCSTSLGEIRVQVENIPGDYTYKLFKDGANLATVGPKPDNDHSFEVAQEGTYTVEVSAPNNCNFIGNVTFTKPTPLDFNAVVSKDINCSDGVIKFNTTGGTPVYNYAIWSYNGVNFYNTAEEIPISDFFTENSINISNGKQGTYQFLVMDANNCWKLSNEVVINKEAELVFKEEIKNISCFGEKDGAINLSIDGNSLGYALEYSIDNGTTYKSSGIFNNLASGTYTVKINATKDLDICVYEKTITLTEPTKILGSASLVQDYTCSSLGIITFNAISGGKPPYKFSIDGSNYISQKSFNNLKSGIYLPSIKDANNCILNLQNITINPLPTAPNFTSDITYSCDGKGSITVKPANTSYTYQINGGVSTSSNVFNNLSPGTYFIDVNYGLDCKETITATIQPNKSFNGFISSSNNVSCLGGTDGNITLSVENFDGNYEYSLNGQNWVSSSISPLTISNLNANSYSVQIKKESCILDLGTEIIAQPTEILVSAAVTKKLSCSGSDATITPNASGGKPPYQYSIDNGISWQNQFTNLSAGEYTIQAKDANNCFSSTNATIEITPAVEVQHAATSTQCYDGSNGKITVNATQGNGNYFFSINNGPWFSPNTTTPNIYTFLNLVQNTYTVKVKDELGCESVASSHTIYPQLNASINVTNISCKQGEISINAFGGDANYVYAIVANGVLPTDSDFTNQNTKSVNVAGNYDVFVRDHSGTIGYCEFVETIAVNKTPDLNLNATNINPKCFGEKGSIKLDITGGSAPYKIELNGPSGLLSIIDLYFNTTKDFINLSAGNYTISVTGKDGCVETTNAIIENPILLDATIKPIVPDCTVIDPSQFGFEFETTNSYNPYILNYSSDNGTNWSTNPVFMNIASGTKVFPAIRLLESDGVTVRCEKYLDAYEIPYPVSNLVVSTTPGGTCVDGFSVTVEAQDGVAPYQFSINSDSSWQSPIPSNSSQYVFDNLTPGLNYTFYVKDATGCIKQNSVDVYDAYSPEILITGNVVKNACPTSNTGEIIFSIDDSKNPLTGNLNWSLFNKTTNANILNGSQSNTNDITVSNLSSGNYYLIITNGASCSWGSRDVEIKQATEIFGTALNVKDITCNFPGIIEINNIQGGFGNYQFTLSSPNFVNDIVTSNLSIEIPLSNIKNPTATSTITVQAKDQSDCFKLIDTVNMNVSENPEIATVTANSCDSNKTITVTGNKGLAPYFYSIDNGVTFQNSSVFNNLQPADYSVKIKDSNGCESATEIVKIIPTLDFEGTITKNLDCSLIPDSELSLNVISGSGNYDFEVKDSSGNTIYPRTNLVNNPETIRLSKADDYNVIVYDNAISSGNCFKTIAIKIPEAILPNFDYTIENSSCEGSNSGKITLLNSNPNLNYTYSLSPSSGNFDIASNSFVNVSPGNYIITVVGSNGCSVDKANVLIEELDPIVVPTPIITQFLCNTSTISENAKISINTSLVSGGTGSYTTFEFINNKGTADVSDDTIVQTGNNSTFISDDKNGGNYTINVYDSAGCIGTTNAIIQPFSEITAATVSVDKNLDCITGENITVTYSSTLPIANVSFSIKGNSGFSETNNTGVFTNLLKDIYTISITNLDTNCSLEIAHQVKDLETFQLQVNKQKDVSCFDSNTGEVSIDFDASTPYTGNYTYRLFNQTTGNPTTTSGNSIGKTTINNLNEGDYYVVVKMTEAPFCEVISEVFSVENPIAALDFQTVITEIGCNASNTGSILINASGGWENYLYKVVSSSGNLIQDYSSNNFIENLSADIFTVLVLDKNGCEISKNITLNNPTPIVATWSEINQIDCFGGNTAEISIDAVSGGQGNPTNYWYQIQKDGGNISAKQKSNIFKGLSYGNYTVTVSDDFSCNFKFPVTINEPSKIIANAFIKNNISCDVGTALVEVTATGGTGNYTFSKDGINFTNSNLFTVTAGNHQFYVKDNKGCISDASTIININPLTPLTAILNVEASLISCATEKNAIISASASGGLGNYEYELLNEVDVVLRPKQTSETFKNLDAGIYKVRVTSKDCVFTTSAHEIIEPVPLELIAPVEVSNITCFGENNGTITINAKGGTGNLIYSINQVKYVNENVFTNLSAGLYDVIVQDENGCFIMETVTIQEPTELKATAVNITNETCFNEANASFSLDVSGGEAPYKTKLNDGIFIENQLDFNNLSGGKTHVVFIEDASGCEKIVTVQLQEAVALNVTTNTVVNCTNYLSTINASVDVSLSNEVTFSLNGGAPQTSGEFKDLPSGTYTLTTSHTSGCTINEEIIIDNPEPLIFDGPILTKNSECFGANNGSITINAKGGRGDFLCSIDGVNYKSQSVFPNLAAGTYDVFVKDELGCEPIKETVVISEPTELLIEPINIVEVSCSGDANGSFELKISGDEAPYSTKIENEAYKENQFVFSNLAGGKTYNVVVKGKNGCEKTVAISLKPAINLNLSTSVNYTCSEGAIVTSRIINTDLKDEITYTLNGEQQQTNGTYENLPPGKYELKATHSNGCFVTEQIEIEKVDNLEIFINTDTKNTLIAEINGGSPPYTYSLNGGDFIFDNTFLINVTQEYTITVKDEKGCEVSAKVIGEYIPIIIPNFFTPNNNNENDFWYPEQVETYHNIRVYIYDRYSRLLKEFNGIQQGWDGIYNGKPMPTGDYWYVIYYSDILGAEKKLIGNFTLYR
ncbi:T9SS type B sorting domain-containing protein [Polaribacter aestuariivivens]|uniref:T9SS type B sorting domain-containing protein n=1 Tax=Polaribacter aestuariivivens TaxID=2304626 RepID=A0A5S3N8Y0_9FLAO|nr:T9SS type B sorting domain-containing protein [Polaribacter aestuariivivens]TMM29899.1 T9SS type B sorting domain-containing protein [Polaribacter aestuariivivens]